MTISLHNCTSHYPEHFYLEPENWEAISARGFGVFSTQKGRDLRALQGQRQVFRSARCAVRCWGPGTPWKLQAGDSQDALQVDFLDTGTEMNRPWVKINKWLVDYLGVLEYPQKWTSPLLQENIIFMDFFELFGLLWPCVDPKNAQATDIARKLPGWRCRAPFKELCLGNQWVFISPW